MLSTNFCQQIDNYDNSINKWEKNKQICWHLLLVSIEVVSVVNLFLFFEVLSNLFITQSVLSGNSIRLIAFFLYHLLIWKPYFIPRKLLFSCLSSISSSTFQKSLSKFLLPVHEFLFGLLPFDLFRLGLCMIDSNFY